MTRAVRLIIRCDGVTSFIEPGESLRFGRQPADNDVVIGSARKEGAEDLLVSRIAGRIENRASELAIANTSTFEALDILVIDQPGQPRQAAVGDVLVMALRDVNIRVKGQIRTYVLEVRVETATDSPHTVNVMPQSDIPVTQGPLALSNERRLDVAALCAPMFDRPNSRAKAASYRDAAELRGITRKAMEKRISQVVDELRRAGTIGGLEYGSDVKQVLCEHVIRSGTITIADLQMLRQRR